MKSVLRSAIYLFLIIFVSISAYAAEINDSASLAKLKTGKGVFLVDIGDARKLNFYMGIIQGTYKGMNRQGVKPDFVVVYIGPSVQYLSKEPTELIEKEHGALLMEIEANVGSLAALGIRQEVCAVATQAFGIKDETIFSDLKLVGDGFISLIGYQAQGYHLVPVF